MYKIYLEPVIILLVIGFLLTVSYIVCHPERSEGNECHPEQSEGSISRKTDTSLRLASQ
jgi:hypothetical protein